jgi:hydrogenase expression/formation protein HypC
MNQDRYDSAVVGLIVEISGQMAKIELGGGTMTEANLSLVDAKVGDLVLLHAGYAIQVVNKSEAERILKKWKK